MKYGMMICGTIGAGYDWWTGTYGTRSKDVKNYLDAHSDEEVNIAVSSPGGFVDEGLTIYQLIKDHGNVNVHVLGMTASIATVLCMGAKHVTMSVGSTMLIHNASTGVTVWESANKEKLTDTAADLTAANDKVKDLETKLAAKDKDIKAKDQEISDLKKAPGAKTEEHLDEGVQDIDADQLYQAMKQIN